MNKFFINLIILVSFLLISINSCKNKNNEYLKTVKDLYNKPFKLNINAKVINKDTSFVTLLSTFFNNEYQIITYIDGDCSICIHRLEKWENYINCFKNCKIDFVFFVGTNNEIYFEEMYKNYLDFNHYLVLDPNYKFQSNFPKIKKIQTFLLINSHIKIIGNPIMNEKVGTLYKRELANLPKYTN